MNVQRLKQSCQAQKNPDLKDGVILELITMLETAEAKLAEMEKQKLSAEVKFYRQESIIPEGLNRCTAELVIDFAKALAEKLYRSEQKYGWSDGWKESDWQEKCLSDFHHHISKGDPRDVAAYCAFMWHHGWSTRPDHVVSLAELVPDDIPKDVYQVIYQECGGFVDSNANAQTIWEACRDAILRNIENRETDTPAAPEVG